jgi:hypothetical protein
MPGLRPRPTGKRSHVDRCRGRAIGFNVLDISWGLAYGNNPYSHPLQVQRAMFWPYAAQ